MIILSDFLLIVKNKPHKCYGNSCFKLQSNFIPYPRSEYIY